ncbi:unnamed protein product [Phytophthora fragariaefolia]|uniref:Unnamed protein product n=1 Tax=Phytophthora fragariaefolia TaxID=1490495 RepID=A0A9W6WXP4_9STRA|nr:unnamed protein product [Phytophthora fragariaefolia]
MPVSGGDSRAEARRVNLPRGSVDDLQRGVGCVELLAQLAPPGVSDKKPSAFGDVAFHPLKPWVAAVEPKGCGVVWDYESGEILSQFDLGVSQVLDDDDVHGSEASEDAEEAEGAIPGSFASPAATPKGLLSRAAASSSVRSMQGAVAAANAAKGLLSPTGASLIKPRRRPALNMLFYDHESIACTTQLPASRTCFDEWLVIVARSHIVICDLDQNGAQLTLLTTPPILMKRSGSGSLPGETRLSTQLHHLACATLDGHVVTWRVSFNASTSSCDCVKTSEVELRDVFRQYDTVNGIHELKFHPQHDVMTAASRDGTIFFFDVAPLLDSNKPYIPPKRLKMASLTNSARNQGELCCLTSYGLLILRATCLASPMPVFIPRGLNNTPAIGFPSSMVIGVRVLGEDPQEKPQHHVVQNGGETQNHATIERARVPLLQYSPWQNGFVAAILPLSGHLEPNKELSGKLTRSSTSSAIVPNKRSRFFFGGSRASAANATVEVDARQQRAASRALTLSIYKLSGNDAEVEFVETSFSSGDDHVLHVFSGPLLGVVKFVADSDPVEPIAPVMGGAIVKRARDSPASLSRFQRAHSFMLGLSNMSSPKMTDLRLTMISPSQSPSVSPTAATFESADSASDLTKTFLEFYEWNHAVGSVEGEPALRKLGGGFAIECPIDLAWDTTTRMLCALVYPTCIKILRFGITSSGEMSSQAQGTEAMKLLHEIPTPSPALSLHWVHHTLFFTTEDEVKCSVISQTRCFTLALASRWVLNEAYCATQVSDDDLNQFPRPQVKFDVSFGVSNEVSKSWPDTDISCWRNDDSSIDQAAELAQSLCPDVSQWLGAVFEAFGYALEALRLLPSLSLSLKVNMCIKYTQLELLSKLLGDLVEQERDSTNLTVSREIAIAKARCCVK